MSLIDFIKKSISNICAKYIEGTLDEEKEILPIFYVAGSQTLPPPLTAEEEEETIKKLDTDECIEARKLLVERNLRLVVYIAKKFENTGIGIEDLISIGTIGLMKSVNTFNSDKKIKLATYASRCIENEILMYLRKENKHLDVKSIDDILSEDKDGNTFVLSEIIADKSNYYEDRDTNEVLENALNWILNLKDTKKRTVLLLKSAGVKQNKIGKDLGFSQSYISRIEKKMKENLQGCIKGKKLCDPICDCRKIDELYKITFYTPKLRSTENIVRIVEDEARKVGVVYCKIKEVKGIYFTITILNEDNSMVFLANLLNQIA